MCFCFTSNVRPTSIVPLLLLFLQLRVWSFVFFLNTVSGDDEELWYKDFVRVSFWLHPLPVNASFFRFVWMGVCVGLCS